LGYEKILVLTPLAGAFSHRAGVLIRSGQVRGRDRPELLLETPCRDPSRALMSVMLTRNLLNQLSLLKLTLRIYLALVSLLP